MGLATGALRQGFWQKGGLTSVEKMGRFRTETPDFSRWTPWQRDLALACLVSLIVLAIHAFQGFPQLANPGGDNDSVMRMVEVLDWLFGQGWYDMHQYRMGPPGGFIMHWSRFVDVPIAAIILAGKALTGSLTVGEVAASILWPALLLAVAIFLLIRLVRRFGNESTILPAVFIGGVSLYETPLFQTNALDHHNVQLVLILALISLLLAMPSRPMAAAGAGVTAALSLVVGMETVPYVAVAGAVVAIEFLLRGREQRASIAAYGAAFGLVSLFSFFATIPPHLWGAPRCDAFTSPQASVALLSGAGIVVIALVPACFRTTRARLVSLAGLGLAIGLLLLLAFPECLAPPFAHLDPRLKSFWLDAVSEAQSFLDVLRREPSKAPFFYATPFIAIMVLAQRIWKGGFGRSEAIFASFLLMATGVTLWELRGSFFSIPFAVVPLAAWVGELRSRASADGRPWASLKPILAWLASCNLVWGASMASAATLFDKPHPAGKPQSACYAAADYAKLASLAPGTVLAISNLGSSILRYTPHRVLAGPYHRDVEGNLATMDAFEAAPSKAEAILRRYRVTIVAYCPGNVETKDYDHIAPDGLSAVISAGRLPAWLTPVAGTETDAIRLYRVTLSGPTKNTGAG
jgi:hypothetical protein